MGAAEHHNATGLNAQNLDALLELQRSKFRAEGEVIYSKLAVINYMLNFKSKFYSV